MHPHDVSFHIRRVTDFSALSPRHCKVKINLNGRENVQCDAQSLCCNAFGNLSTVEQCLFEIEELKTYCKELLYPPSWFWCNVFIFFFPVLFGKSPNDS